MDVGEAVGAISAQLRLRFAEGAGADIGFVALATLRHLVRHGPCSVTELAGRDRVTTQAISLRVAPLVRAGLIHRLSDPADGRRSLLEATDRGRKVVRTAQAHALAALDDLVAGLPEAERSALTAALPVLHKLGTELAKGKP
ncbi:MAG: MarR family transcriptional regulator [Dactylosporangium sp.]|nr:MarR family transcriptional regulator [Dactylosporangium sp.]